MLIHVSLHPVALKGVVPTNYPATTEPHGLRRPKSTNALIARSRSKRQRHDPPRLLRARRERPHGRAAEQRYELAALHSITSSARASSVGGTSRPSAFAVLRLITSSYFVGACTGRSIGLNSSPNDGATAWIARNWPPPEFCWESRKTAARVRPGAICLSSSS